MPSTTEQVLNALKTAIDNGTSAEVKRNTAVPEKVPAAGLVIIRDGDPGEPDEALGGFDSVYYTHTAEIELYVEHGNADTRDQRFDTLLTEVGAALEGDETLGGLIYGMSYGRPSTGIEPVPGSDDIKNGSMQIVLEYETPTPLG